MSKTSVLDEFWLAERNNTYLEDVIRYGDLGLPVAFLIEHDYIKPNKKVMSLVNDVYSVLCATLQVEDVEYDSWAAMQAEAVKGD